MNNIWNQSTVPTTSTTTTSDAGTSSSVLLPTVLAVVLILTFFVVLSTGSVLAVGVLWIMVGMVIFLLATYGFISAGILAPVSTTSPAPTQPIGSATSSLTNVNVVGSEVFHLSDNQFTYDDAPAVCAAYGAQLATLEQIINAYNHGAEWCGYGWSAGGMALYPTQKGTWDALQGEVDQGKRTACGRPGVNGGYFDPSSKFGVNCYGIKPQGNVTLPTPLPGTDQSAFNSAVSKFKAALKSFNLDPYSRTTWSASSAPPVSREHFALRESFRDPYAEVEPGFADSAAAVGSPYGLKGSQGDIGPMGPAGPVGAASTVPGPAGGMGPTGPQGSKGDAGVSNVAGPTGPAGTNGTNGMNGSTGPAGATGPQGFTGPAGAAANTGGKTTLAGWTLDGNLGGGGDLTVFKDGRQDFIFRDNSGWPEFWINRGGNWKKYD